MTIDLFNRLKSSGYQRYYRHRHILARKLDLSDPEYRLWDLFAALAGWDPKYEHKFKKVKVVDREIASLIGVGWSYSKVNRVRRGLTEKGILEKIGHSYYLLKLSPEEKVDEEIISQVQRDIAEMQISVSSMHQDVASVQQPPGVLSKSSLVSFKGIYDSLPKQIVIKQEPRTDEEYQQIHREGNYQYLTLDDMKWVDENIKEVKPVQDEATEADYVEIFFDGDWEKYKSHLVN